MIVFYRKLKNCLQRTYKSKYVILSNFMLVLFLLDCSLDFCSTRTIVFNMDRRFDFGVIGYIQKNVGIETRIRRRRAKSCPQEDFLKCLKQLLIKWFLTCSLINKYKSARIFVFLVLNAYPYLFF